MEGPQVKIPLDKLREALKTKSNKDLKELVKIGLTEMAERHQLPVKDVTHLEDDVVNKIREEQKKFDQRLPYPPTIANNLSVQIELPVRGKVGVCEWNSVVVV